ncbi:MAG: hypothetical protein LBG72_06535 [Spirochaetaceae bacterium]|nr:hypothetical protein [Spirochaetaceae bacterium]
MNAARKIALSLLCTVILSAGFALIAFTGFFDFIQLQFYDPALISAKRQELNETGRAIARSFDELDAEFAAVLSNQAVKRSFSLRQNEEDIAERVRILGELLVSVPGLLRVRFVDERGLRIHYSTEEEDILSREEGRIAYKNYYETEDFIPFVAETGSKEIERQIQFEGEKERAVFYFPFYDALYVYRGAAIFTVSIHSVIESLTAAGAKGAVSVISEPKGIVMGQRDVRAGELKTSIAGLWREENTSLKTNSFMMNALTDSLGNSYLILTLMTYKNFYIAGIYNAALFEFSNIMKIIMLTGTALTLFILFFFVFNLKHDPVILVQNRIKSLQVSLIEEYYNAKETLDWKKWRWELEQRREEIRRELKRGIKVKPESDAARYIDSFFEKSWDDLLTAIGKRGAETLKEDERLENILKRILEAAASLGATAGGHTPYLQTGGINTTENLFMSEIRARRETEKAYDAYANTPELLEDDPLEDGTQTGGSMPKIPKPEDDAEPVEYGELEALPAAEPAPEAPEALEELEEIEEADELEPVDEAELGFGRMEYGSFSNSSGSNSLPADGANDDFDVEEFEDASEEEAGAISAQTGTLNEDFEMDITSPVDYIFAKDVVESKDAVKSELHPKKTPDTEDKIIKEKDGIHYIDTSLFGSEAQMPVDSKFKNIVDGVLN